MGNRENGTSISRNYNRKRRVLYPDSILETLQKELHIGMPLDGKPGIQLLLETASEEIVMQLEGEEFQAEWYQMREIPVEYNTGDGENQGGAMVLMENRKKASLCDQKGSILGI